MTPVHGREGNVARGKQASAPWGRWCFGRPSGTSGHCRLGRGTSRPCRGQPSSVPKALEGDFATVRNFRGGEAGTLPVMPVLSSQIVEDVDQANGRDSWHPSLGWKWLSHHLSKEELWEKLREEARFDAEAEPTLASTLHSTVLVQQSFEKTLAFILANKLASTTLLGTLVMRLCMDAFEDDLDIIEACTADLQAAFERDPACDKYMQCMLYFKGYQALQSHRIAHWLWKKSRKALAIAIQNRISEVFHVDIHPAAQFGRGVLIDHATGVVIGETAIIGDNVSMLHHVTLGGSGTGKGSRHPHIGHGVLLGAGVTVLGGVEIGRGAKIGAGSVVVSDLPAHAVAVGVPAKIIKTKQESEPVLNMDQCSDFNFQI